MSLNQLINLYVLFFILSQTTNSQDRWVSAGADAIVSRNASEYTTEQITYKDQTKKPSSTMGDIQYAYDIYSLNLNEGKANVPVKLFSNATSSYLLLEIDTYKNGHLFYELIDMEGKVLDKAAIKKSTLTNNKTQINVILLPISSYILTVFEDDKKVESFKINKTNKY